MLVAKKSDTEQPVAPVFRSLHRNDDNDTPVTGSLNVTEKVTIW